MAYKINGVIRLANNGDANLGVVTATSINSTGVATATEFDGKVSKKAITEQTAGDDADVTGADELLIYDQQTDSLLRVSVDDFISASGIGTLISDFTHVESDTLLVTGLSTLGGVEIGAGIITASSPTGIVTFYGDGQYLEGVTTTPSIVSVTEPTQRPNGTPLQEGDLWFFTGTGEGQLRQYTYYNSAFVDSNPAPAIPPLQFEGDSGSGSVSLGATFTIAGSDNIETVASGSTITISLKSTQTAIAGTVTGSLIPDTTEVYDLGSETNRFHDIYLSGSTINLGGINIQNSSGKLTADGEDLTIEGSNTQLGVVTTTDLVVSAGGSITAPNFYGNASGLTNLPEGATGATGLVGPPGATGLGASGSTGATGSPGPSGPQGATGADSIVPGPPGATGPKGDTGNIGNPGPPGDTGPDGATGAPSTVAGPPGPEGPVGPASTVAGPPGPSVTGPPGPEGPEGPTGPEGPAGPSVTGPPGPQGATGLVGPPGTGGTPGGGGPPGPPGPEGPEGPDGPPGPSVTGPPGPEGPEGPTGPSVTGPPGPPGPSVTGPPGPEGPTGPASTVAGPPGPGGPAGPPGPAGVSATLTAGTYLSGSSYNGSTNRTWSVNASSGTSTSNVVARDTSGNYEVQQLKMRTIETFTDSIKIGKAAGLAETVDGGNVFIGLNAGEAGSNPTRSTFVGKTAGFGAGGDGNTYIGSDIASANTGQTAFSNTAIGAAALNNITSGSGNFAGGIAAGNLLSTGNVNVFLGQNAGSIVSSGAANICIGNLSGDTVTTGNANTLIGNTTDVGNANASGHIALGSEVVTPNTIGPALDIGFGANRWLRGDSFWGLSTNQLNTASIITSWFNPPTATNIGQGSLVDAYQNITFYNVGGSFANTAQLTLSSFTVDSDLSYIQLTNTLKYRTASVKNEIASSVIYCRVNAGNLEITDQFGNVLNFGTIYAPFRSASGVSPNCGFFYIADPGNTIRIGVANFSGTTLDFDTTVTLEAYFSQPNHP